MSTLLKDFHFQSDAEGWAGTPDSSQLMTWRVPRGYHRSNAPTVAPLVTMGGCLRTTAIQNIGRGVSQWIWTGTWEDLGVPVGAVINSVDADYIWRIDQKHKKRTKWSEAVWVSSGGIGDTGGVSTGPFELLDSGLSNIGTFSNETVAPDNPLGTFPYITHYYGYPEGSNTDAVSFRPVSWEYIPSDGAISISAPNNDSSDTISLAISVTTPDTLPGTGTWVKVKHDYITVTVDYTLTSSGVQGGWFFS